MSRKDEMEMNTDELNSHSRLLIEVALEPIQGSRFQPTGFADLGAATYTRPGRAGQASRRMLLVESAQSMANRLEKTCLNGDGPDIDPEIAGLPYLKAKLRSASGDIWTSSLVEAHRLGSPYFLGNKEFRAKLAQEMNYDQRKPLDWFSIHKTIFRYDANCLVHGVFLSLLDGGRVRVPRALSAFIEAADIEEAHSGGVKNSPVDPKGELQLTDPAFSQSEKGVYSNVPFQRVEFTAGEITAFFNLDLSLIRGYGLGKPAERMLVNLALLKVRRFLDRHLRLRTACDFRPLSGEVPMSNGASLPSESDLLGLVKQDIVDCSTAGLFASPPVSEFEIPVKIKEKKE